MAGQLLALELRQRGIPLLLIHPGTVTTGMYHRCRGSAGGHGGGGGSGGADGGGDGRGGAAAAAAAGSGGAGGGSGAGGVAGGMAVSAHGAITPQASAAAIVLRVDELRQEQTGRFVRAATGEVLRW